MSFYKSINSTSAKASGKHSNTPKEQCYHCNQYGHRMATCEDLARKLGATTTGKQTVAPTGNVSAVRFNTTNTTMTTNTNQSARSLRRQRSRQNKSVALAPTEEEMAAWEEEQDRLDDLEDRYMDNYRHTMDNITSWAANSSEAAFDHFMKTGDPLENNEFMGSKAGAMLKSEYRAYCDDGDYNYC
jgi:hypothetical protein